MENRKTSGLTKRSGSGTSTRCSEASAFAKAAPGIDAGGNADTCGSRKDRWSKTARLRARSPAVVGEPEERLARLSLAGRRFQNWPVGMARETVRFCRDGSIAPRERGRAMSLQEVVTAMNERAQAHAIGGLPEWRKQHKGKRRLPRTLFYSTVPAADKNRDYVFHVGGLSELQFNIGFEPVDGVRTFRYGTAFSLQPTQEFPASEVVALLTPKIERFNKYVRVYPAAFKGFQMWHWLKNEGRSETHAVGQIPDEWQKADYFVFIGRLQPADAIDIDAILEDLDRLLPVYEYVEGETTSRPAQPKASGTVSASYPAKYRARGRHPTSEPRRPSK
jgi:hypothetical protein